MKSFRAQRDQLRRSGPTALALSYWPRPLLLDFSVLLDAPLDEGKAGSLGRSASPLRSLSHSGLNNSPDAVRQAVLAGLRFVHELRMRLEAAGPVGRDLAAWAPDGSSSLLDVMRDRLEWLAALAPDQLHAATPHGADEILATIRESVRTAVTEFDVAEILPVNGVGVQPTTAGFKADLSYDAVLPVFSILRAPFHVFFKSLLAKNYKIEKVSLHGLRSPPRAKPRETKLRQAALVVGVAPSAASAASLQTTAEQVAGSERVQALVRAGFDHALGLWILCQGDDTKLPPVVEPVGTMECKARPVDTVGLLQLMEPEMLRQVIDRPGVYYIFIASWLGHA